MIAREAEINPAIKGRMGIVADQASRYPKVFSGTVPESGSDAQGVLARLGSGMAAGAAGGGALFGLPGAIGGAAAGVAVPSVVRKIMGRVAPAADIEAAAPGFFRQPEARTVRPPPEPQAPEAPGGLFADTIPGPQNPGMPSAGRPDAGQMPFNQILADRMAGDLSLEGAPPNSTGVALPGFMRQRPLDSVDFVPPEAPPVPGQGLPPLTQDQLRLAPEQPLSLEDARPASLAAMLDDSVPLSAEGLGAGTKSSFADRLGIEPAAPFLGEALDAPRGMPTKPRGVSGPFSAQLTDPQLPEGFQLLGEPTPPPQPHFGPADEFPEPGGSFADQLSLEPDAPRVRADPDFLDMVDTPTKPGAQFVTSPGGYLSYTDVGGRRVLDRALVAKAARGQGEGKANLLEAANRSAQEGIPLDSDSHVKIDQLRVYDSLRKAGKLNFEVDEAALQKALAGGTDLKHSGPVFRNIRPAG